MAIGSSPLAAITSGGVGQVPSVGGGIIVDPSRPDLPGWRWLTQGSTGPLAGFALAGGGAVYRPAAGGLVVQPDSDSAVVRLDAWWSGAPYLRILRMVPGQPATPVRPASPLIVDTMTRTNRCTNPSFETAATGWNAGTNTTVTTAVAATQVGNRLGRLTATAAGAVSSSVPVKLSRTAPMRIALGLRFSAAPSGSLTFSATWVDILGVTSDTQVSMPAADLAAYVSTTMYRTPVLVLPVPADPVDGAMTFTVTGMPAGGRVELDAVMIEDVESDGTYFDGDYLTGAWQGAAGLSSSTLAGRHVIDDFEAPLDVPIRYLMTAPDQSSFRVLTEPVVLESKRRTWLSHPSRGLPMQVNVHREPDRSYALEQGVHKVVGRKRPVVVAAATRQADTGSITIDTTDFFQRDRMLDLLDDGSPLLIRSPANLGHGPGEWMAFGDVDVTSAFGDALEDSPRFFELPYTAVDPPALPDIG